MQATGHIPKFECRELRDLLQKTPQKCKDSVNESSLSARIAAYSCIGLAGLTICSTSVLFVYGACTFKATSIVAGMGIFVGYGVVEFIAGKIFGSINHIFLNITLARIANRLIQASGKIHSFDEFFLHYFMNYAGSKSDERTMMVALIALVEMQKALNELSNACDNSINERKNRLSFEELNLQQIKHLSKMSKAARLANEMIAGYKAFAQPDRDFGITQKHVNVINLLSSFDAKAKNEKHHTFNIEKEGIFETLMPLCGYIPMVDSTEAIGLNTYLEKPVQKLKEFMGVSKDSDFMPLTWI